MITRNILVTGGAGFIGHHLVKHLVERTKYRVIVLDKLNYASNGLSRLRDVGCVNHKQVKILTADFSKKLTKGVCKEIGNVDYIVHMGGETHVENAIENPEPFVLANVLGTMHILDFARTQKRLKKMIYFSTDEVFGPAPKGTRYKEWDRYNSSNPYSASKAGGEELCLAYTRTYGVPVVITHTMNVFGERQHSEKFIPKIISQICHRKQVLIHADSTKQLIGSRFWLHAQNVSHAVMFLLNHGQSHEKYNIVGEKEVDNLEVAENVAKVLGRSLLYKLVDFHPSRPGHDLRYALDGSKMKSLGWEPKVDFYRGLKKTIGWYMENQDWLLP